MARKSAWQSDGTAVAWGAGAVLLLACGGAASTDERWEADEQALLAAPGTAGTATGVEYHCERAWRAVHEAEGYQYPDPPAFWLGSQEPQSLAVDGAGFLVLGQATGEPPTRRYARQLAMVVGPDGTLEDDAGRELLGYLPGGNATGECLTSLRVPFLSPPRATSAIVVQANLDSRNLVNTFDITYPEGTSNGTTNISVWDSDGGVHTLELYFSNQGGYLYQVSVVVEGSELAGGPPGPALIGSGWLQFTVDGALYEEQLSTLDVTFWSGAANQPIDIDFGDSLQEGSCCGLNGTTGFASDTVVYAQWQDGLPPGVGSDVTIDGWGDVHVQFDSGATLAAGRLAIARFPREAKLSTDPDGVLRETAASGEPLLGRPLDPGRGSLRSD